MSLYRKTLNNNIIVLFLSLEENEEQRKRLQTRWGEMHKRIMAMQNSVMQNLIIYCNLKHLKIRLSHLQIMMRFIIFMMYMIQITQFINQMTQEHIQTPTTRRFVTVELFNKNPKIPSRLYVTQICSIDEKNAEVLFLVKTDKTNIIFSFSKKEDRSWVNFFQIKILLPVPVFDENDLIIYLT